MAHTIADRRRSANVHCDRAGNIAHASSGCVTNSNSCGASQKTAAISGFRGWHVCCLVSIEIDEDPDKVFGNPPRIDLQGGHFA
jgi:hypothetical protein